MTQCIPCPPSPTSSLNTEMGIMGFQDITGYGLQSPPVMQVIESTPIIQATCSSPSYDEQSTFQRRARLKSLSTVSAPRKRSFSRSSTSSISKKPRTFSRYFDKPVRSKSPLPAATPTRFEFSFVGTNKAIPSNKSMSHLFRSRSPLRMARPSPNPLTPYKDGQVSWPFPPRYRRRSRSNGNSDVSSDECGDDESEGDKRPINMLRKLKNKDRKRLIDKLNGASFVLDPKPSTPEKSKNRNKKRCPKRINRPSRPVRVWVKKYEEIAQRDAEAEARILAMGGD